MMDQTQAVYAAEDLWSTRETGSRVKFGDWNEVWPFYYNLVKTLKESGIETSVPNIAPRKGALAAHYDASTRTVYLPPYANGGVWALTVGTALHEFAHHMTPGSDHGAEYREAMITCLDAMGWDSEPLKEAYAEAGLTDSAKGDSITDKVSKLLVHAEKAGSDAERDTYLSKAESLATEHSINLALVRKRQADSEGRGDDRPTTGELFSLLALPNTTYRNLAVELGCAIANAHGVETTIRGKSQHMTFYGYTEDIRLTELLFTRVTPMMFEASDRYLKTDVHKQSGVASVSARITFCKNFAYAVGDRLKEAVKTTTQEIIRQELEAAYEEGGNSSTEIALRDKEIEVRDYVQYEFKRLGVRGRWGGSKTSSWSSEASSAGHAAGQRANLFGRKELA